MKIFTHQNADLDAVMSTWLLKRFFFLLQSPELFFLPAAISSNHFRCNVSLRISIIFSNNFFHAVNTSGLDGFYFPFDSEVVQFFPKIEGDSNCLPDELRRGDVFHVAPFVL